MSDLSDPIVIVAAKRTPIGQFNGVFARTPAQHLGAAAIKAALDQASIDGSHVNEVLMGCVLPAGLGQAPARQAALYAGLPQNVPCTTVNKMCGSGMKTVMLAHDALVAGSVQAVIAGGMENMSMAPYLLPKARFGYRLGHGTVIDHLMLDGLEDAYEPGQSMGFFAEQCATKFKFTREEQDAFALESVTRAKAAQASGNFNEEIVPVTARAQKGEKIVEQDEGPLIVKIDKIPKLKPAFLENGTVTAANASSISDGAAALFLMRQSYANTLGLKPMAIIHGHFSHAQAPNWFTTASIDAIRGLLQKVHWHKDQVDLFEINEAFAVVTMATTKELQLDPEKVNVHGGACVLGHPIGASGARILTTLLYALKQRQLNYGIAALCIGGGEATAIAVERCG